MSRQRLRWPLRAVASAIRAVVGCFARARTSRWLPTRLGDCLLWVRAGVGVSGPWSLVTRWADRTHGRALEARAPTDCPTLVWASLPLRERPALRFDSGGGMLEVSSPLPPGGGAELAVFVVFSAARRALCATPCSATGATPAMRRVVSCVVDDTYAGIDLGERSELRVALPDGRSGASGVHILPDRPYVVGLVVEARAAVLLVDGARVRRFTRSRPPHSRPRAPLLRLMVGARRGSPSCFAGDLGDLVVYRRALGPLESAALSASLMRRYAVGQPRRPRAIDRLRRLLGTVRAALAEICYGTPRGAA